MLMLMLIMRLVMATETVGTQLCECLCTLIAFNVALFESGVVLSNFGGEEGIYACVAESGSRGCLWRGLKKCMAWTNR
jgi:hypothetical protein